MLLLVGIGLLAGAVTAISPCVLPVVPLVLADAVLGSRRRVLVVVCGLVAAFTGLTLGAAVALDALRLPADALRIAAIVVVVAAGVALTVPRVGALVGRPFHRLARRRPGEVGGGLLYGASLALLFTPCAGPVIAAVATVAASRSVSLDAVAVTVAFGLGAGLVLLALGLAGRRLAAVRAQAPRLRRALGVVVVATGVLIALGFDRPLATRVPDYAAPLRAVEESASASHSLAQLTGRQAATVPADALDDFGPAPDFRADGWLNTAPLSLGQLRGRVVLVDFWTYSCLNCLRTLPTLRRWSQRYARAGLVVVGVHTPEFAFERDAGNVRAAARSLHVSWPVALDRDYATWKTGATTSGRPNTSSIGVGACATSTAARATTRTPRARSGRCSPSGGRRLDRLTAAAAAPGRPRLGRGAAPRRADAGDLPRRAPAAGTGCAVEPARRRPTASVSPARGGRSRSASSPAGERACGCGSARATCGSSSPAAAASPSPSTAATQRRSRSSPTAPTAWPSSLARSATTSSSCARAPASPPTPSPSADPG